MSANGRGRPVGIILAVPPGIIDLSNPGGDCLRGQKGLCQVI